MAGHPLRFRIDAVAEAGPHVPFDGDARARQRLPRHVQRLDRDQVVRLAVDEQHRRARLRLAEVLRPRQQARVGDDAGGRRRAPQPHVQGHHAALAEAHQNEPVRRQAIARELGVEKAVERRLGGRHPAPVLARIAQGEREPLQPAVHAGDRLGRIGRDERRIGQRAPPAVAERDQVVAVGAVAVQQHHQRRGPAAARLDPRSVEGFGHRGHHTGTAVRCCLRAA